MDEKEVSEAALKFNQTLLNKVGVKFQSLKQDIEEIVFADHRNFAIIRIKIKFINNKTLEEGMAIMFMVKNNNQWGPVNAFIRQLSKQESQ